MTKGLANENVVVIKVGGSIFKRDAAYRTVARHLRELVERTTAEQYIVVVSARDGETNRLEQLARTLTPMPSARTLDLLWSTGELRSVAFLTLQLEAAGIRAVGLNIHETGLQVGEDPHAPDGFFSKRESMRSALAEFSVVVVPGFLATNEDGVITSLGRGGSDFSAVVLALGLGASRCELVKDVPGYFAVDPKRDRRARHLPEISYDEALGMADSGCELVQRQALVAAAASGLKLVIRSLKPGEPHTVVGSASRGILVRTGSPNPRGARMKKRPRNSGSHD